MDLLSYAATVPTVTAVQSTTATVATTNPPPLLSNMVLATQHLLPSQLSSTVVCSSASSVPDKVRTSTPPPTATTTFTTTQSLWATDQKNQRLHHLEHLQSLQKHPSTTTQHDSNFNNTHKNNDQNNQSNQSNQNNNTSISSHYGASNQVDNVEDDTNGMVPEYESLSEGATRSLAVYEEDDVVTGLDNFHYESNNDESRSFPFRRDQRKERNFSYSHNNYSSMEDPPVDGEVRRGQRRTRCASMDTIALMEATTPRARTSRVSSAMSSNDSRSASTFYPHNFGGTSDNDNCIHSHNFSLSTATRNSAEGPAVPRRSSMVGVELAAAALTSLRGGGDYGEQKGNLQSLSTSVLGTRGRISSTNNKVHYELPQRSLESPIYPEDYSMQSPDTEELHYQQSLLHHQQLHHFSSDTNIRLRPVQRRRSMSVNDAAVVTATASTNGTRLGIDTNGSNSIDAIIARAKKAASSLWILLHSQNCKSPRCLCAGCKEAKLVLLHLKVCPANAKAASFSSNTPDSSANTMSSTSCPTDFHGCDQARKLLAHYRLCKSLRMKSTGGGLANASSQQQNHQKHQCLVCLLVARHAKNMILCEVARIPENENSDTPSGSNTSTSHFGSNSNTNVINNGNSLSAKKITPKSASIGSGRKKFVGGGSIAAFTNEGTSFMLKDPTNITEIIPPTATTTSTSTTINAKDGTDPTSNMPPPPPRFPSSTSTGNCNGMAATAVVSTRLSVEYDVGTTSNGPL